MQGLFGLNVYFRVQKNHTYRCAKHNQEQPPHNRVCKDGEAGPQVRSLQTLYTILAKPLCKNLFFLKKDIYRRSAEGI